MSLPPGFLDELRSRISLSQVVGRKVTWDRKSNQAKGDMWAPCPFHQEKTASFHVDDRKGFFHCFGCHISGDAITFVRESENVGFMEAVEILAREAAMEMPAKDPQAKAKADRRTQLAEVMEQAVQWFALQLKTGAASEARDYLARRGLDEAALKRWEIGFAPAQGGAFKHLTGKGVPAEHVIAAGLAAESDRGGAPYDRFRGRIIFPIRDARGRAIAFGGRAMDPNARAKYLNSPETELFDKGRSLYNHAPAREAAGKGNALVVAEGYMDVIALAQAGFDGAVAPLGTAVTGDQLQLLWRMGDEPIVALDGDKAGLAAAMRVMDTALPLLEAGRSLRFALMPPGQDPDDLIRAKGPEAMQQILQAARPMVDLLWQRETEGKVFDSPERRAALDRSLRAAIAKIQDPTIRRHYGDAIKEMRWQLFRPAPPQRRAKGSWKRDQPTAPLAAQHSALAQGAVEHEMREAVVLAVLLSYPHLLERVEDALERLEMSNEDHTRLRDAILFRYGEDTSDLRGEIERELGGELLEKLFSQRHIALVPALRAGGDAEMAAACLKEEVAKLLAWRGAAQELDEALEDFDRGSDEATIWRLSQAAEARNNAVRSMHEDTTQYDVGPNGARMSREERGALDDLLNSITFTKGRNAPQ
ncbi:DNA primase [Tranquillimonas rosea]|uniref:DNA primase n=1 Tax=Tranquillimonas rosea TaxID=641238 RepID=A0A1H9QDU9_9RHOB|nr:DNA primase [Tranquillimonas rosea]SER58711.1 DNA primase [Tranquillimonas rosea]